MDDLEEVRQRFEADVEEYVAEVERAVTESRELAGATEEAKVALDGIRDKAVEAAAALGIYRDEQGRIRDEAGRFVSEAKLQELGFSGLRDKAIEAAVAIREVRKEEEATGRAGLFSRLRGLFGGGGGGSSGGGGFSLASLFSGGLTSPAGIFAIAEAIQVALPEVAALATGLTAAGLGAGSFAALAIPAFDKVKNAYSQINKDQQAYDNALTSKQRKTALEHLKQDWAALNPQEAGAVRGVQQLTSEFSKMSKAFEPTAFKVLDQGIGIVNKLLPYVQGFANAAAPAIEQFLGEISKSLSGGQFKDFMKFLESLAGPSITAIGHGIEGLLPDIAKLMELFSKKDVINSINIAFRLLGFTLEVVIAVIKETMKEWDLISKGAHDIAHDFDVARHSVAEFGHDVAHYFDDARHDVASFAHDVAHYFDDVRHDISKVGATIKRDWKDVAAWLISPIGMAVYEIRTHTHQIAHDFDEFRHGVAHTFDDIRHDIAHWADEAPRLIARAWDTVRHETAHAWDTVRHDVAHGVDDVVKFTESIPGKVLDALKKLPADMENAGKNAITGLINGIKNAAAGIPSLMKGLAGEVESYFTNPLKIFSPSRKFFDHGVSTVMGFINAVRVMKPQLQAAMRDLGMSVATGGIPGISHGGYGGAAPSVHVQVPVTMQGVAQLYNTPAFLQYLQSVVQEAILRYQINNPMSGLALPGRAF